MFHSRSSAFNVRYTLRIFQDKENSNEELLESIENFRWGNFPSVHVPMRAIILNKLWWIRMHTNSRMQRVLLDDKDQEIKEAKKELEDAVTDTNIANEQLDEYMVSCLLPPLCTSRAQTHH